MLGQSPARQMPRRWGKRAQHSGVDGRDERRAGRKIRPVSGDSVLMGSGGEGGRWVGAAWRRSERERGRGGGAWHGVEQRGGMASARCPPTVEDYGVGMMRDGVADSWAGRRRGPSHQWLGAA
jgi:hypothetical protein